MPKVERGQAVPRCWPCARNGRPVHSRQRRQQRHEAASFETRLKRSARLASSVAAGRGRGSSGARRLLCSMHMLWQRLSARKEPAAKTCVPVCGDRLSPVHRQKPPEQASKCNGRITAACFLLPASRPPVPARVRDQHGAMLVCWRNARGARSRIHEFNVVLQSASAIKRRIMLAVVLQARSVT